MAIDGSVHCHTGNARVVGFFGLEPKSVGAAADLVVDFNRLVPVDDVCSRSLSIDRRLDASACPANVGRPGTRKSTIIPICFCAPEPGTIVAHHDLLSSRGHWN